MNKKYYYIILIVTILTFTGCKSTDLIDLSHIPNNTSQFTIEDGKNTNNIEYVLTYDKHEDPNILGEVSCYTIDNSHIYYAVNYFEDMSSVVIFTNIYVYNTKNNEYKLLYEKQYDIPSAGVSVIKSTSNKLFWVEENEKWQIIEFDNTDSSIKLIKENEPDLSIHSPNISIINNKLCWFNISNSLKESNILVEAYDPLTEKLSFIPSEKIVLASPYSKLPDSENSLIYTAIVDNKLSIVKHNIVTSEKETIMTNEKQITYINGNDTQVIWSNDWIGADIYLYDFTKSELYNMFKLNDNESFRSASFKNDNIVFDFSALTVGDKKTPKPCIIESNLELKSNTIIYSPKSFETIAWVEHDNDSIFFSSWKTLDSTTVRSVIVIQEE